MLVPGNQPGSSLLQTLRSSQAQIGSRYASVSEQFGPNYPEAKQLKAQLADATREVAKEESRIVEQAKMSFDAAQRNQAMTSKALANQKDRSFKSATTWSSTSCSCTIFRPVVRSMRAWCND